MCVTTHTRVSQQRSRLIGWLSPHPSHTHRQSPNTTGSIGACPLDFTNSPNTPAICGALAYFGSACPTVNDVPPKPQQDVEGKVALIGRGGCAFADKIKAARVGGSGWKEECCWVELLACFCVSRPRCIQPHIHTQMHTYTYIQTHPYTQIHPSVDSPETDTRHILIHTYAQASGAIAAIIYSNEQARSPWLSTEANSDDGKDVRLHVPYVDVCVWLVGTCLTHPSYCAYT